MRKMATAINANASRVLNIRKVMNPATRTR